MVEVAEIDPMVCRPTTRRWGSSASCPSRPTPWTPATPSTICPDSKRFDLIFGDAFNDLSVPYHLTTVEFAKRLKQHMTPDGAYLMNIIDDWRYALFLGSMVNTLQKVFKHTYVFCTEKEGVSDGARDLRGRGHRRQPRLSDWLPDHGGAFAGSALRPDDTRASCTEKSQRPRAHRRRLPGREPARAGGSQPQVDVYPPALV